MTQGFPYKRYPRLIIRELQAGIVNSLNVFPSNDGVSATVSPGKIVSGRENQRWE